MNSSRTGAALRWLSTARRNARLIPTNQSTQVAHPAGSGTSALQHDGPRHRAQDVGPVGKW